MVQTYGQGYEDVAGELKSLLTDPLAREALMVLRDDFTHHDATGPSRVANFLADGREDEVKASCASGVGQLVKIVDQD